MLKIKTLLFAVSMIPFVLNAQNLLKNGDAEKNLETWENNQIQISNANPHSGKNCFEMLGNWVTNSQIIAIDPLKSYKLSGWVKNTDTKKRTVYLSLMPLDANKERIKCENVNSIANTETELAEACRAEDTVIKIKDANNWKFSENKLDLIAFNILNDYKDLPNFNISGGAVIKAEIKNTIWELTLDKACGKTYPAGTKVRQHQYASGFIYPVYQHEFNSADWKELTGEIKGMSKFGAGGNQFWAGTKYVQVIIGGMIYFDDIKFEEQKGF